MRPKVTVLGANGLVRSIGARLASLGIVDVALVDGGSDAAALDAESAGAFGARDSVASGAGGRVTATSLEAALPGSAVVVLGEGANGGARYAEDGALIAERAPDAVLVVAGRPSIARCDALLEATRFPRGRVIGTAAAASSALLSTLLARELGLEPGSVRALACGGEGDSCVVLVSQLDGVARAVDPQVLERCVDAVRESVPGDSTEAAAAVAAVAAVVTDAGRLLACAVRCGGEYGIDGSTVWVPALLGTGGVRRVMELDLPAAELDALRAAAR